MLHSYIAGVGSFVPPNRVTNDDLSRLMTTSHDWIVTRSGIEERRFADEGVYCSDLALEASKKAIADAGISPSDVDFIIFATLSPDYHFPGTACYLQPKLGLNMVPCMDVRNQCTGFLYSLAVADAFVKAGMYKNILVVGAEVHSSALDFTDEGRDVAVLFGDGAGAVIVQPSPGEESGILYSELHADGSHAKALHMDIWDISRKPFLTPESCATRERWPTMKGKVVFKHAITRLVEVVNSTLAATGVGADDIKFVIPHQANMRINQFVAQMLEMPQEKFLHNMQVYGNTTAASIPLLLDETYRAGKIERGDLLMLLGFGSGFTWGATLLRW